MSKFYKYLLLAFLFLIFFQIEGANYYFSTSIGLDSRTPKEAQHPNTPWKTVQKLNSIFPSLLPGDKILFKSGDVFYGQIIIGKSGTAGNPITLGSYGTGSKPVITSFKTITEWTSKGGNIFETKVGNIAGDLNVLTIDKVPYAMGRFPNLSEKNAGYLTIQSHNGDNLVSSKELQAPVNFTGGEVVIRKNNWILDRHFINSHSGSDIYYNPDGSDYKPKEGYGFFIQNHLGTLDKKGEWYYNKTNKSLFLYYPEGSPSFANVEVATLDLLLDIKSQVKFVEVRNLSLEGSNENMIEIWNAAHITITDCEIKFSGKNAIHSHSSSNLTLQNSIILDSYNGGIYLQWEDNNTIIRNNVIDRTFRYAGMGRSSDLNGNAIFMSETSDNGLIEQNKITNSGYLGIHFNGNNTIVKNNVVDTFCLLKDDGAGIYTWTGPSNIHYTNRKVINNIVINGIGATEGTNSYTEHANGAVEGIYMDDNASGVEIKGNTIANISNSGIYLRNARNINVLNNKVYNVKLSLWLIHDNLGNAMKNINIYENQFLLKYPIQQHINIRSKNNDLIEMGSFNNNIYASPLNDIYTFYTQLPDSSNGNIMRELDLDGWTHLYQKDENSKKSPVSIPYFGIISNVSGNKINNGSFNSSLSNTYCWSPYNDCKIKIENNVKLDSQSLKIDMPRPGIVAVNIGSIYRKNKYNLNISVNSENTTFLKAYLRQSESPYSQISETRIFRISENRLEINELLTATASEENAVLIIESDISDTYFSIDNLVLEEVEAKSTDPDDHFLFAYNDSLLYKTVALSGTYVDLENKTYSGSISIEPYSSILLIKTSESIIPPSKELPKINITYPNNNEEKVEGTNLTIKTDVFALGGNVKKVEFFNGESFLGNSINFPYLFEWESIPVGIHYITAKITDSYNQTASSDPFMLTVIKNPDDEPNIHLNKFPDSQDFTFQMNTGSSLSVDYHEYIYIGEDGKVLLSEGNNNYINPDASESQIFTSEKFGKIISYGIPVLNGTYTIQTFHNELYFGKKGPKATAGQRVYNISLEGEIIKNNIDLFAENKNKETIFTFENVEVHDGILNLDLRAIKNNASISGLAIYAIESTPTSQEKEIDIADISILINAGSRQEAMFDNELFLSDFEGDYFSNGSNTYTNSTSNVEPLYQSHRYSKNLTYHIPVPNGSYSIVTYHYETYFGASVALTGPGRRVFDIYIEGNLVKGNFDMYIEKYNQPIALHFKNIEVKDGIVDIDMVASRNNALISGIAIISNSERHLELVSFRQFNKFSSDSLTDEDAKSYFQKGVNFSLYPNPAKDFVTLSVNQDLGKSHIIIHTMNGKLVDYQELSAIILDNGNYQIPVHHLQMGTYLMTIVGEKKIVKNMRLIISP